MSKTTKRVTTITIQLPLPLPKLQRFGTKNLPILAGVRLDPGLAREAAATTSLPSLLVKGISLLVVLLLLRRLVAQEIVPLKLGS